MLFSSKKDIGFLCRIKLLFIKKLKEGGLFLVSKQN
jgi:hypothetical protein